MRFVIAFLLTFVATVLGVAGFNAILDPDGEFLGRFDAEDAYARALVAGGTMVGVGHLNLEAFHAARITHTKTAPTTIVIGSSRSMLIGNRMLNRSGVANHGIPSSRLLGYMGVIGQYLMNGLSPQSVVIGVDPWVFKAESLDMRSPLGPGARWLANDASIDLKAMQVTESYPWRQLISAQTLQQTLTSLWREQSGTCAGLRFTQSDDSPCPLRRPDGSFQYPASERDRPPSAVAAAIRQQTSRRGRMHSYDGYDSLSSAHILAFTRLLEYLERRGTKVTLFLPPFHPLVEENRRGTKDWEMTIKAEKTIQAIAMKLEIPVVGHYSAASAGCAADEFYDDIHAKESCVSRILSRSLIGRAAD